MKSLKLNFKTAIFACLAFFLSNNFCTAQSFYVTHRIESEILKYEITKLDTKDPAYKTKLADLQKQEAAFSSKATALEDAILKTLEEGEKNPKLSPIKISHNGVNISMENFLSTGVRPVPGPRPCQGGVCQDFFIFAQKCDWASAKMLTRFTVNGTAYQLYSISGFSGTMSTERHTINSNSNSMFSRN